MRNLIPILVLIAGLLAVAVASWLLISSDEDSGYSLDPDPGIGEEPAPPPGDIMSDIDHPGERPTEPDLEPERPAREVEKVLPTWKRGSPRGGLRIHVAYLDSGDPFPAEGLDMKVLYQDVPLEEKPRADGPVGDYILEDLLPGRYRVRACTPLWERGAATALVQSGEFADLVLLMSTSSHLQVQVVDQNDGSPVHNARLSSIQFIERGVTDEKGRFRSARPYTPDSDLAIKISHPMYFSTRFEPLHPEKAGATRIGSGETFRIPLEPRAGDLTLAGTATDGEGEPLKRWVLFLYPQSSTEAHIVAYTGNDGGFQFNRLSPGTYLLCATLRILMFTSTNRPPPVSQAMVELLPGQSLMDYRLVCSRTRAPLAGRILQADTLGPAESARISCHPSLHDLGAGGEEPLTFEPVTTDENGSFATKETFLPETIFQLLVNARLEITSAEGFTSGYRPVQTPTGLRKLQSDIIHGLPVTLWLTDEPNIKLKGTVLDASGRPLPEVRLSASSMAGVLQGRQRGFTNEEGFFQIPYLFSGPWVIQAQIPGGPTVERMIRIEGKGKPQEITIRLKDNCRLEGRVEADPPPTRVRVYIEGLAYETEPLFLGPDLAYSFQHLPAGKARVVVEAFERNRFQENFMKVMEDWVQLEPERVVRKDFSF
jgi:hypothetical protein